jgi:curli biogenesis system outer membrane secretion channel CsgG
MIGLRLWEEKMNRILSLLACLTILAGCGTSTKETVTADKMPEVGNYPPPPAGARKIRAAVVEFQDKSGTNCADAAGEQLETQVVSCQRFSLIDRMQLKQILKEQNMEGIVDPAELAKPGKVRGVDYLLIGVVTNFRLMTERSDTDSGILDRALGSVAPLHIDTSKTIITTDVGVDIKLVNTTTGEIVCKEFGEVKKQITAKAWGVRVIGTGGDARNNVQVDRDSQGKILRHAVDEALRKMLPRIDEKLTSAAAAYCPKCKTEIAAGAKFCAKCGTIIETPKCECGADLEPNAKFCSKCGKKVEPK